MGRPRKFWTHDGRTQTLAQWADELGLTTAALHHRMASGRPPDQVFAAGRLPSAASAMRPGAKPLTHDGRTQTMRAWAAELGISLSAFSRRISRGWPSERVFAPGKQAAVWKVPRRPPRPVTHDGRTQSIRAWAAELGVSYSTLLVRLGRHGDVAAALASGGIKYRMLTHDGRTQPLSVWARESGIMPHTLLQRLARGWPMGRALLPGDRRRKEIGDAEQD